MKSLGRYSPRPERRWPGGWLRFLPVFAVAAFGIGFAANTPGVQWRAMLWYARFRDSVLIREAYLPTPRPAAATPDPAPSRTPEHSPASSPAPSPTPRPPTPTPEPLPPSASLSGFRYEPQKPNACGPATLAIVLSYYGWTGTQSDTLADLKPKLWDKNVRPDEMLAYAENTGLRGLSRWNGDLETIKRFVSAGIPIVVQKGIWLGEQEGWLGHYEAITAYDDAAQQFTAQDTFQGPDFKIGYQQMLAEWRAFNYNYLIVYRPDDEAEVFDLMGSAVDAEYNTLLSLERAQAEADESEGQARAFALFNQGTSLAALYRYQEAALAFDEARREGLPWRMLWYLTGPYRAYFYSGRYDDVIELANATLARTGGLEESLYWRGQARQAMGDPEAAVADYREALKNNPNFEAATAALAYLGYSP